MIVPMKNYVRIGITMALSLSLITGQVSIGAPLPNETILTDIPVSSSPLDTAHAILKQVQDAATQLAAQQTSVPESETFYSESPETETQDSSVSESESERLEEERHLHQEQLEHLSDYLNAQNTVLTTPQTGDSFPSPDEVLFHSETWNPFSGKEQSGSANKPGGKTGSEEENETESISENTTETESEMVPPEETETEFHPVEMGASLPDTGGALPEEYETETESSSESAQAPESETSQDENQSETPKTETPESEIDDSVMISRHGVFAIPKIGNLNEARINLYDYRMLREYPLSRLPKDLHQLYNQLKEQVAGYDGTWSVYVQNLTTGQALVVNDSPMRSASVMKLFIMETVYEAFDRGDLPRNEDTVYLLRSMIVNSSNESSNRLLTLLGDGDIAAGIARVNEFIHLRGFNSGTIEYNGFEDPAATMDPDHANTVMAKDVGLLLSRVYNRSFISRAVCNEIEQMMLDQETRYKIPRGLPEGVQCGNKSGETDTIANDAAVIYGPTSDYILVVLSNDWENTDTANAQIAEVSAAVYSFFEA